MEKIILNPGRALGDTLCAIAIARGIPKKVSIVARQIFHPLFQGIGITPELGVNIYNIVINYWPCLAQPNRLLNRDCHIVDWMNFFLKDQYKIISYSTKDDVKIQLTEKELLDGKQFCQAISNRKPIVAIASLATTKNRTLPNKILENILSGISHFSTPLILESSGIFDAEYLPHKIYGDLRKTAAVIAASDAMLTVDSGLAHLAAAAYQGNETNLTPEKVIMLIGSFALHPYLRIWYAG